MLCSLLVEKKEQREKEKGPSQAVANQEAEHNNPCEFTHITLKGKESYKNGNKKESTPTRRKGGHIRITGEGWHK